MDRRSLLTMFAAVGAAAAVFHPAMSEAMPVAPQPGRNPGATPGEPAVATPADLEGAKMEKTYWVWRRRHRHRFYWRRRFYRRHYWRPYRRFHRRRWFY